MSVWYVLELTTNPPCAGVNRDRRVGREGVKVKGDCDYLGIELGTTREG